MPVLEVHPLFSFPGCVTVFKFNAGGATIDHAAETVLTLIAVTSPTSRRLFHADSIIVQIRWHYSMLFGGYSPRSQGSSCGMLRYHDAIPQDPSWPRESQTLMAREFYTPYNLEVV